MCCILQFSVSTITGTQQQRAEVQTSSTRRVQWATLYYSGAYVQYTWIRMSNLFCPSRPAHWRTCICFRSTPPLRASSSLFSDRSLSIWALSSASLVAACSRVDCRQKQRQGVTSMQCEPCCVCIGKCRVSLYSVTPWGCVAGKLYVLLLGQGQSYTCKNACARCSVYLCVNLFM